MSRCFSCRESKVVSTHDEEVNSLGIRCFLGLTDTDEIPCGHFNAVVAKKSELIRLMEENLKESRAIYAILQEILLHLRQRP